MKILVCFKAVPDLETLTGSDWQPDDRFRVETRFVKTIINPLDESALELALKFRDKARDMELDAGLSALTIGCPSADPILKTLAALQFDRMIRLSTEEAPPLFNPEAVADAVCSFIEEADGYDLIVMGGRSADGDNSAVPLLLAEKLSRTCLTQVTDFRPVEHSKLEITCQNDEGELRLKAIPPLVLAIGNAPSSYLRVPTLKDRMTHGKREIEIIPAKGFETDSQTRRLISLAYQEERRAGEIIEGSSAEAKAAYIYQKYLRGLI